MPDLQAISIRDRDDEANETTQASIVDKAYPASGDGFKAYKWRRRHIENYLLHPAAIARGGGKNRRGSPGLLADKHGLALSPADVRRHIKWTSGDRKN